MPFTLSHPAAALPVRRVFPRLPLDALVIGTMSPDFEYVLRLAVRGTFGHSLAGLLLFCVPVSLAACAVFRGVVKPAVLTLFPRGLADRLREPGSARGPGVTALAALLGAATHLAWDGFTHRGGWAVTRLPILVAPAAALGLDRPWYNLLQHASTLAGAALLALWTANWLREQPAEARRFAPGERGRTLRIAMVLLGASALAGVANAPRAPGHAPEAKLAYAAVGAMAGLALSLTAFGVHHRLRFAAPEFPPRDRS